MEESEAAAILIELEDRAPVRTAAIVSGAIQDAVAGFEQAVMRIAAISWANCEMVQHSQARSILVHFEDRSDRLASTSIGHTVQRTIISFDQIAFGHGRRGIDAAERLDGLQPWLS